MRRLAIILCGLCLLGAFAPEARAQGGPGGIFNILTSPIRGALGVLGGPQRRGARRSAKRTRTVQQKPVAPAAAVAPAAIGATAAVGATAVATAPSTDAPASTAATSPAVAPAETKPQTPKTETAKVEPAKTEIPKAEFAKPQTAEAKAYWPAAHEDLIGYIFWPRDYDDKLWAHGFGEIMSAVFVPMITRTASTAGTADMPAPADTSKLCGPGADSADWPNGRVAETLQGIIGDTPPTAAQQDAIKGLQTALADAMKAVRSACTDIVNAPPAARMQTMLDRLWAIRVAGYLVREPLKTFYGSLNAEQKAKFERGISDKNALDVCAAASAARIPFPILERTIRPTAEQRKAIATLQRKVEQASASLRASCPLKPPASPIARLDAALDRVDAITYAAGNLAPAFGDFYASLTDDQRTRLSQLAR